MILPAWVLSLIGWLVIVVGVLSLVVLLLGWIDRLLQTVMVRTNRLRDFVEWYLARHYGRSGR